MDIEGCSCLSTKERVVLKNWFRVSRIHCDDGKAKRIQFAKVEDEFKRIASGEIEQVQWDRAGYARLFRVDNVIVILIAEIHVEQFLILNS